MSACAECGVPADPARDVARIRQGRVVVVCRACAGHSPRVHQLAAGQRRPPATPTGRSTPSNALHCGCGAQVDLLHAHIVVGASTHAVELHCPRCVEAARRAAEATTDAARESAIDGSEPPTTRRADRVGSDSHSQARSRLRLGVRAAPALLAVLVAVVIARPRMHGDSPRQAWAAVASAPVQAALAIADHRARPVEFGEIISVDLAPEPAADEAKQWVHPLPQVTYRIPPRASRRFGAHRDGERPPECGAGHCGMDFFNARGTPIVAVADGVVERVVLDVHRPAGNYVSVRHADHTCTQYMHLDDVLDGLRPGDYVAAGDMIGSLGQTGFLRSLPHLHFAHRVPGPGGDETFADPAPMLRDARVIKLLELGMPAVSGGTARDGEPQRAPNI